MKQYAIYELSNNDEANKLISGGLPFKACIDYCYIKLNGGDKIVGIEKNTQGHTIVGTVGIRGFIPIFTIEPFI